MTVEQFIEDRCKEQKFLSPYSTIYKFGLREGIELMGEFAEWVGKLKIEDKWKLVLADVLRIIYTLNKK